MIEREFAIEVVHRLQDAGFQALWAGGCVRDELLGLHPADHDIATNALPHEVKKIFRRCIEVGVSFGVIEVLGPRGDDGEWLKVQVATFRQDGHYSDGRRPDSVTFSSAEEDALRRDFTINGMFYDPVTGELIDYVGGKADLEARVLRAIGDPAARFAEDKLRVLRAVRMATRFDLAIDPATLHAAQLYATQIRVVSPERIADELRKLLVHPNRARGLELLRTFDLVQPILPELVPCIGLPQGFPHAPTGDLWEHLVKVMGELEGPTWPEPAPVSFPLAFGALLHDIGKPRTLARTPDRYTFHGHEHVGKRMAEAICKRLRLSNEETQRVTWLVERHQYLSDAPTMRKSTLMSILVHPGIGDLLALHRADALASGRSLDHVHFCEAMLWGTPPEVLNPPPLLTGDDLIAKGWRPGPDFKLVLEKVREAQLEGTIQTRDEALALAEQTPKAP